MKVVIGESIKWLGYFAIGIALSLGASTVALADVVAVVSASSSVSHMSKKQIADIFLGRAARFPDGEQAVPIDQEEGSATRDEFYATFAGKDSAQLKVHWSKVIFTGRGQPPKALASGVEVRKWVATSPHAIAYMDRSLLDSSVKALQVD